MNDTLLHRPSFHWLRSWWGPMLALAVFIGAAETQADSRPTASIRRSMKYYVISGRDERSLLRQMRRFGPRVGGRPALASTRMQARYRARLQQRGAYCRVKRFHSWVRYTITLPRPRDPRALKADVRKRWRQFDRRLRAHEAKHIAIWNGCLKEVRRILPRLRARNCTILRRRLKARYREIMQACGRKHDAFDAREQHVATSLPFIRAAYS